MGMRNQMQEMISGFVAPVHIWLMFQDKITFFPYQHVFFHIWRYQSEDLRVFFTSAVADSLPNTSLNVLRNCLCMLILVQTCMCLHMYSAVVQ